MIDCFEVPDFIREIVDSLYRIEISVEKFNLVWGSSGRRLSDIRPTVNNSVATDNKICTNRSSHQQQSADGDKKDGGGGSETENYGAEYSP